MEIYVII